MSIGFGALILIVAVLGGFAIIIMAQIRTLSVKLAEKYVPEVAVSNDVERFSLLAMYQM